MKNLVGPTTWAILPSIYASILDSVEKEPEPEPARGLGKALYLRISGTLNPDAEWYDDFPVNELTMGLAEAVKGYDTLILHISSGGGQTRGIAEAALTIKSLPVTTVAFIDNICASAAYWLASACDVIVAHPSAIVGSIGVLASVRKPNENNSSEYSTTIISKGELKVLGNPDEPITDAEVDYLTKLVDAEYEIFADAVAMNRKMTRQEVDGLESATFRADATVGTLVDYIGTFNDIIN